MDSEQAFTPWECTFRTFSLALAVTNEAQAEDPAWQGRLALTMRYSSWQSQYYSAQAYGLSHNEIVYLIGRDPQEMDAARRSWWSRQGVTLPEYGAPWNP